MKNDLLGKVLSEKDEKKQPEKEKTEKEMGYWEKRFAEEKRRNIENCKELASKLEKYQCELRRIVGENLDGLIKYVFEHACSYYNLVSDGLFKKKYRVAVFAGNVPLGEKQYSVAFTDGISLFVEKQDYSGKTYVFDRSEKGSSERYYGLGKSLYKKLYKKLDGNEGIDNVTNWLSQCVSKRWIGADRYKDLTMNETIDMLNNAVKGVVSLKPDPDGYCMETSYINKYLKKTPEERVKGWISDTIKAQTK